MKSPKPLVILVFIGSWAVSGCRMGVPVHTWKPAALESTVGKRVVLAEIVGPRDLADDLQQRLLAGAPRDIGRKTTLVDSKDLEDKSQIQLAAASNTETSDVVLASVARAEGYDYVLAGEVLEDFSHHKQGKEAERLKVSWRLFALGDQRSAGGVPVVVDTESALRRYPDLALAGSEADLLKAAAVRDTYRLITASIQKDRARLAIPYLLPGSKETRRGNIAALKGRWNEAEEIWSKVAEQHPTQTAAIHNLALAAAAAQDFSRAKELARKAIRRQPNQLHKQTLVWIELRQRDYHEAFDLPDPPEGWFVTGE